MVFYMIRLKSFPEIKFAFSVRTDKYKNIITYRKNSLEMSVCSAEIEVVEKDKRYIKPKQSLSVVMPDMDIKLKATDASELYLTTVAIEGDFEFERFETDSVEECAKILLRSEDEFVLPLFTELGSEYSHIECLMRKIIFYHPQNTVSGRMNAISVWCEIVGEIDDIFRKKILGKNNESLCFYYSRKVQKYIETHYNEKLEVKKLADNLRISPNYLSNIFKRETGLTIREFIAYTRISAARKLLYEKERDFDSVAKQVGLSGARNLNEHFNKYYGMSIQKCILADREISLYHKKPWEIEHLEEDILGKLKDEQ